MQQGSNTDSEAQSQFITALEQLRKLPDFLLYLLDAINNNELTFRDRFNAASLMRHELSNCATSLETSMTTKILKKQLSAVLIPLLISDNISDDISNEFTISIAALIAEAAYRFGMDIFPEDFDQTIINLLAPTNSRTNIFTALNLIQDLLNNRHPLNPQIILCFTKFIGTDSDLTCKILEVCGLFAQNNCYEIVKKAILPPFFENLQSLPKEVFISLINASAVTLIASQTITENGNTSADPFDSHLISFIISCMNDSDDSKSIPAMAYFHDLQDKLGFIPEAVILLYNNLANDDGLEIGENETVQGYISTLNSIAESHPAEMLQFIIPQIKQDLAAFQNQSQNSENGHSEWMNAMKRGLRGISAISNCISDDDIGEICLIITELLNNPMRKEAISTLESIALTHPNLYPQILNTVFPFICINSTDSNGNDEASALRMQARRSLINMTSTYKDQTEIPYQPYISYVSQMLQISIQLASPPIGMQEELNSSVIFIGDFFKSTDPLITDDSESEFNLSVKNIISFAIQIFLSANIKDPLLFYSFRVISSAISNILSSFMSNCENQDDTSGPISIYPISFSLEIINKIHMKCVQFLNSALSVDNPDDELPEEAISMYSSLFSILNCKNEQALAFKDNILEIVQSILPNVAEFLSTNSKNLSITSWGFASAILRSPVPQLFQHFLMKSAIETVLDLNEFVNPEILGNIALVYYDAFKLNIFNLQSFPEDDFESLLSLFSRPIESQTFNESSDILDIQNISLVILRISALANLQISQQVFMFAVNVVQSIQEEYPNVFEEAQQLVNVITQNGLIKA